MIENLSPFGPEQDRYFQEAVDGTIESLTSIFNPENRVFVSHAANMPVFLPYFRYEEGIGFTVIPGSYINVEDTIDFTEEVRCFDVKIFRGVAGFERVMDEGSFNQYFDDKGNRGTMVTGNIHRIHNALATFLEYQDILNN